MSKKLVAYFSAEFGKTKAAAEKLAAAAGADLYEITPAVPYTKEDLYWPNEKCRSIQETKYHPESRPEITGRCENMEDYDFIYLGFPIWCGTVPTIVRNFLESYDFSGKTIAVFATSGGGGMGRSVADCKACCSPDTKFLSGKLVNRTRDFAALAADWT